MKRTFFKNLYRDIRKTLSRFLSIVIIIAIGVSFYAGVRATSPDMKISGDFYFNEYNLMDFKLISTLGLTEDDISAVRKLDGVTKVQGTYSLDAIIEMDKKVLVLNVNSLPEKDGINKLRMVRGRLAENSLEAVVEEKFLEENNLKLNDKIVLKSGSESDIKDNLKNNEFKIVGTADSPLYISAQRQLSSVGNGSVRGFVYILPEVFKSEVYTEIYVRTERNESKNSLLNYQDYEKATESIEKSFKDLGVLIGELRYADVLGAGEKKIEEAEIKLNNSKKEASEKFADGYRQLEDAENKISKGLKELEKNQNLLNKKMTDGKKEIEEGKSKVLSGEKELNSKTKEIQNGKLQIAAAKKQLSESEAKLSQGKKQAADSISSAISAKAAEAKKQLENSPNNPVLIAQYNSLNQIYEANISGKDFDSMYNSLKRSGALEQINAYFDIEAMNNNFNKAEAELNAGKQQIADNEKQLLEGEAKLRAGRAEIEQNKKKLADAEIQLSKGIKEGQKKLDEGRKELIDGQKKIVENTNKLKAEEAKANAKFKDGEVEIQKNRNKLQEIKKPDWYVLGRNANVGYETYRQDSDGIDNIGKAFPLIFFLVAALVSLTTMARMVQEKRTEIGTLKALGYSRTSIVAHYLIYSLSASLIGSLIGISIGFRLFPPLIMNAYGSLYTIPYSITPFNTNLALQSSLIAILFTTLAAVAATLDELREVPASLMRPKPPKVGKKILLERVTFIWERLSFTKKVTARNIFRYKQRFFMTVIGIATCTGLMITGFSLKGGVLGASEKQFSEIYKYDMRATLGKNVDNNKKNDIKNEVKKVSNIKAVLFTYSKNSSVKLDGSKSEDAYIVVPEEKDALNNYISLKAKGKDLKLDDDGVIITQKFSMLIDKKIGDTFEITIDDKVVKAKISAITEHYVQHFIYMSPVYYEKIAGEKLEFSGFYGLIENTSEDAEEATSKNLKDIEEINSASFKNNSHIDFNKTVKSINSVVLVLIVSAGVLAFVVIYNLTNININERKRELATIKLLGFYNSELASYIYRENIILTIIGSLTGILVGITLSHFVISTAETNVMMFLRTINPIYFLYSVIITIFFSVVVNLIMYKRFDKIDMIESLKSAE